MADNSVLTSFAPRINEALDILFEKLGRDRAMDFLDAVGVLFISDEDWAVVRDLSIPDDDPRIQDAKNNTLQALKDAGVNTFL